MIKNIINSLLIVALFSISPLSALADYVKEEKFQQKLEELPDESVYSFSWKMDWFIVFSDKLQTDQVRRVVKKLIDISTNRDEKFKRVVADGLGTLGQNLPPGEAEQIAEVLLDLLKNSGIKVAAEALGTLAQNWPPEQAKPIADALLTRLVLIKDDEGVNARMIRASIAEGLGTLAQNWPPGEAEQIAEVLLDLFKNKGIEDAAEALGTLAQNWPPEQAKPIADALLVFQNCEEFGGSIVRRLGVAKGLGTLAQNWPPEQAGRIVEVLIELLQNKGIYGAAEALGTLAQNWPPEQAKPITTALLDILNSSDEITHYNLFFKVSAAEGLSTLAKNWSLDLAEPVAEALITVLVLTNDKKLAWSIRYWLAKSLGTLAQNWPVERAKPVAEALFEVIGRAESREASFEKFADGFEASQRARIYLDKLLQNWPPNEIQTWLKKAINEQTKVGAIEWLYEYFSPNFRETLNDGLKAHAFTKPPIDLIPTICSLAQHAQEWDSILENLENTDYSLAPFGTALLSLKGLFLLKSAAFCDKSKEQLIFFVKDMVHQTGMVKVFGDFFSTMAPGNPYKAPSDSEYVFGKQFYLLLVKSFEEQSYPLGEDEKKILKSPVSELGRWLDLDSSDPKRDGSNGSSLMTTYALATSILALDKPSQKTLEILRSTIGDPNKPLEIKYSPGKNDTGRGLSTRGSAARAVPVYLALYRSEASPEIRDGYRTHLIEALKNFQDFLPSLLLHANEQGFPPHMGADRLGSHYFYSTIPYVTAAIRMLLNERKPEEIKVLRSIQADCKLSLAMMLQSDGKFRPLTYDPSSSGYVNSLAGLALLPLIEEEGKMSLGILREDGWPTN